MATGFVIYDSKDTGDRGAAETGPAYAREHGWAAFGVGSLQELRDKLDELRDGRATVERAAERIRQTKFKVQAYAEYLGAAKDGLLAKLGEAQEDLRKKVVGLGSAA
jgi:hypothetical protein